MALAPTYLIGSDEMEPKSTLDLLTASNVKVITVPSGNTLADLDKRIDVIAKLTHSKVQAKQVKQQAKQAILALKKSTPLTDKISVLFLMISKGRLLEPTAALDIEYQHNITIMAHPEKGYPLVAASLFQSND